MIAPDIRGTRRKTFRIGGAVFDTTALTANRTVTVPDSDVTLGSGGGGVTDHGALTGLADDDHAQYHNDARGDARYSVLAHNHSGVYDPAGSAAAAQAAAVQRANHTGTQLASTVSDFSTAADARIAAASINALTDVTVTAPSTGQVLKYDGAAWINDTDATGGGGGGLTQPQVSAIASMRI